MNLNLKKQKLELTFKYPLDKSETYEYTLLKLLSALKVSSLTFKQVHYHFKYSLLKSPHINKKAQESFRQNIKKLVLSILVTKQQFVELKDFFQNRLKISSIKIKRKII